MLIKGKDVAEFRKTGTCGCVSKRFPLKTENDLKDWMVIKRSLDAEEKWSMQMHSHPDFEEYWFVIEGEGQFIVGDKIYDVEVGDLVITPPGVPHKAIGDVVFVCTMAKHNSNGKTIGSKQAYVAHDTPYRDDPEELPKVGERVEFDATEELGGAS